MIASESLTVQTLRDALKPFVSEAKTTLPEGSDPTIWIQLQINMDWLKNAYLALYPEKEAELKDVNNFYSSIFSSETPKV